MADQSTIALQTRLRRIGLYAGNVDGIAGPLTKRALERYTELFGGELELPQYTKALHYRRGRTSTKWIVLHTMEASKRKSIARNCATYFANTVIVASAHYCVDAEEAVQCVDEVDTAWHCQGPSDRSIGIELAGYAKQSPADWCDEYNTGMLRVAASLIARISKVWGIPLEYIEGQQLIAGKPGVTTHVAINKAYYAGKGHTDPGPNFPMQSLLQQAKQAQDARWP